MESNGRGLSTLPLHSPPIDQIPKNELGDRYGMRSASALGKEWYEHSAGWCGYLKGKNAVEIGKLSADGTDADLKALCTISVTDLQKATLKAMAEQ